MSDVFFTDSRKILITQTKTFNELFPFAAPTRLLFTNDDVKLKYSPRNFWPSADGRENKRWTIKEEPRIVAAVNLWRADADCPPVSDQLL